MIVSLALLYLLQYFASEKPLRIISQISRYFNTWDIDTLIIIIWYLNTEHTYVYHYCTTNYPLIHTAMCWHTACNGMQGSISTTVYQKPSPYMSYCSLDQVISSDKQIKHWNCGISSSTLIHLDERSYHKNFKEDWISF